MISHSISKQSKITKAILVIEKRISEYYWLQWGEKKEKEKEKEKHTMVREQKDEKIMKLEEIKEGNNVLTCSVRSSRVWGPLIEEPKNKK